ncbi:MAG: ATP-grasp domain-containing protein [Bdellovibrionia bacterium]
MANSFQLKLGILGGGQLARLLAQKAHEQGFACKVLSSSKDDPAAQVTAHHLCADINDESAFKKFCQDLDYLTFESEFIDVKKLAFLDKIKGLKIFPSLKCMGLMQDRWTQKTNLKEAHLPTADFVTFSNAEELRKQWQLWKGLVIKKRRGGYDGNGTFVIKSSNDLEKWLKTFSAFKADDFIAEKIISFKRECAFSMARNASGEMVCLPLVESKQVDNRCDLVVGPIQHPKLNKLISHCAHFLEDMGYEGIMAFELFDTGKDLIVNEVAPRVHNSAHHSLSSLNVDQFTLHLKAGLDDIFYEVKPLAPAFAMINLIGASNKPPQKPQLVTGQLSWYGKTENRPGRKMGHINYVGKNIKSLSKLAYQERAKFKNIKGGK